MRFNLDTSKSLYKLPSNFARPIWYTKIQMESIKTAIAKPIKDFVVSVDEWMRQTLFALLVFSHLLFLIVRSPSCLYSGRKYQAWTNHKKGRPKKPILYSKGETMLASLDWMSFLFLSSLHPQQPPKPTASKTHTCIVGPKPTMVLMSFVSFRFYLYFLDSVLASIVFIRSPSILTTYTSLILPKICSAQVFRLISISILHHK